MLAHLLPCRGLHEIISTNSYVRIYKQIMQNKPKVKYAKINLSSFVTMKYVQVRHLVIQTNKPKQTQFKPKQTQFKPNLSQNKANQSQFQAEKHAAKILIGWRTV